MSTPNVVEFQSFITKSDKQEFLYLWRKVMLFQCEYLLCSYFIRLNYPFGQLVSVHWKKNTMAFLSNPLYLCHLWLYFTRLTLSLHLAAYVLSIDKCIIFVKILPILQISLQKLSLRLKVFPDCFIYPVLPPLPHQDRPNNWQWWHLPLNFQSILAFPSCDN